MKKAKQQIKYAKRATPPALKKFVLARKANAAPKGTFNGKAAVRKVGKALFALALSVPRSLAPKAMFHDDNDYANRIGRWETVPAAKNRINYWRFLGRLA